jgi:hypothetical protein
VLGNLDQYTRFQAANAIGDAARNEGGIAGVGASLAVGAVLANQMTGALPGSPATPPPLPSTGGYYVGVDGAQTGPFDLATLATKVKDGSLTRTALIWKPGMGEWSAAEKVADLAPLFAAVPPPLPH